MNRETRLVVKDNALIDASFNLTLVEQRLMLLAIVQARELDNLTPDTPIEVKATTYRDQYGVHEKESYNQLVEATDTLFNRQFSYINRDGSIVSKRRWLMGIDYIKNEGKVKIYMSSEVISMISRLEANFTQYLLEQVSDFKSKYSIRLYELIVKYRDMGKTKRYGIGELRDKLGLEDTEYERVAIFKRDVINKAIDEINDKTDITVSYENIKAGRIITHFLFKIKKKKENSSTRDKDTIDMFTNLTDKQIDMFGDKLSKDEQFQLYYLAPKGQGLEEYARSIKTKLSDPFYVKEWMKHLERVGYTNKKKGA